MIYKKISFIKIGNLFLDNLQQMVETLYPQHHRGHRRRQLCGGELCTPQRALACVNKTIIPTLIKVAQKRKKGITREEQSTPSQ